MELSDIDKSTLPNIKEYYKGKTVFITGGSGFMGKVLIEKLLYSCSDLERIYLLMRSKRGVQPKDRLAQLYDAPCFERLKKEKPDIFASKVFLVAGDVSEDNLGLSDEDRAKLVSSVHVVFHVAASVRFDDSLRYATKLNLKGTKQMIYMACEMKNLESFIHVSTSYSNTHRESIDEVMYPPHADWRGTLEVCEKIDSHTIDVVTSKYIGSLPNTYVFTKQLAEHVVYEQRGKLPVVIIRPSVAISSQYETVQGFNDNFNGPVGILAGLGKGVLRTMYGSKDVILDYVPVDHAIRHFIVASWLRGSKKLDQFDEVPIYNCASGSLHKVTFVTIRELGNKIASEIPLDNNIFGHSDQITNSRIVYYFSVIFKHLLPALIFDMVLRLLGQKPRLFKIQRRLYNAFSALQSFTTCQWTFLNKNFLQIREKIKDCDKAEFYYKVEHMDYYEIFKNGVHGARKFILKEKDEDLPKARKQYKIMTIVRNIAMYTTNALITYWIWNYFFQNYFECTRLLLSELN